MKKIIMVRKNGRNERCKLGEKEKTNLKDSQKYRGRIKVKRNDQTKTGMRRLIHDKMTTGKMKITGITRQKRREKRWSTKMCKDTVI